MKTGIVTTLIALCLPVSRFCHHAAAFQPMSIFWYSTVKVSSSLLRGADSIELDNGPHPVSVSR